MKENILLFVTLCTSVIYANESYSQTRIDLEHNSLRTGDVVKKYCIDAEDIWDLSDIPKSPKYISESYETFKPDTITRLCNGSRGYHVLHSDSLLYVGTENPLLLENYYLPELTCLFPMALGDEHRGCFGSYVNYCDKMRFHKYGIYSVCADSIGDLTLPNGDIVGNVLQVSSRRKYRYEPLSLDSLADLPLYKEKDIPQAISSKGDVVTEHTKKLYLRGYRYPIIEEHTIFGKDNEIYKKEIFYSPVYDQEGLPLDDDNITLRHSAKDETQGAQDIEVSKDLTNYIAKDRGTKEVVFDFESYISHKAIDGVAACKLLLSDCKGIVYRSKGFTANGTNGNDVRMSYSGLRHGQYIISVIIDSQKNSCNFIID